MKAMRVLLALAAVGVAAGVAWAGGCSGFGCANKCPLAQEASLCRSFGTEGPPCCKALADEVEKSLAKI